MRHLKDYIEVKEIQTQFDVPVYGLLIFQDLA